MSQKTEPLKFERCFPIRPANNIMSSDFAKFHSPEFNYMRGMEDMNLVMANEYHRLWRIERDKLMAEKYPKILDKVDVVKRYVQNFSAANYQRRKAEVKKPFKIKKFEEVPSKTDNRRPKKEDAAPMTIVPFPPKE